MIRKSTTFQAKTIQQTADQGTPMSLPVRLTLVVSKDLLIILIIKTSVMQLLSDKFMKKLGAILNCRR